jgi:hypothetical protein
MADEAVELNSDTAVVIPVACDPVLWSAFSEYEDS